MSNIPHLNIITVSCAIIEKEGKVLCAQRSEQMQHPLKWEFPGGKVEDGETAEACLKREIREELNLEIEIIERLPSNSHCYIPGKIIELIPYRCKPLSVNLILKEHAAIKWMAPQELLRLDWVAADIPILQHYYKSTVAQ